MIHPVCVNTRSVQVGAVTGLLPATYKYTLVILIENDRSYSYNSINTYSIGKCASDIVNLSTNEHEMT